MDTKRKEEVHQGSLYAIFLRRGRGRRSEYIENELSGEGKRKRVSCHFPHNYPFSSIMKRRGGGKDRKKGRKETERKEMRILIHQQLLHSSTILAKDGEKEEEEREDRCRQIDVKGREEKKKGGAHRP